MEPSGPGMCDGFGALANISMGECGRSMGSISHQKTTEKLLRFVGPPHRTTLDVQQLAGPYGQNGMLGAQGQMGVQGMGMDSHLETDLRPAVCLLVLCV